MHDETFTHFFYDYQDERSIDPMKLIENGIASWQELVHNNEVHDNSYLWELAKSMLKSREQTPIYSWVERLRFKIMTGGLVPDQWNGKKSYPYKGLLISAIYFQEASRLCLEENPTKAWHITVLAYYHLGMNTIPSALQNASRAAQIMHANRTEKIRAMVLAALDKIKKDGSASSIQEAKEVVIKLFIKKKKQFKYWLNEFDTLVSDNTKGKTTSISGEQNDVFVRISKMLDSWALPSGPYPEIAEAFSHFSTRKLKSKSRNIQPRTTIEKAAIDEADFNEGPLTPLNKKRS